MRDLSVRSYLTCLQAIFNPFGRTVIQCNGENRSYSYCSAALELASSMFFGVPPPSSSALFFSSMIVLWLLKNLATLVTTLYKSKGKVSIDIMSDGFGIVHVSLVGLSSRCYSSASRTAT